MHTRMYEPSFSEDRAYLERETKDVNLIVVHCSDSDVKSHDNPETIEKWHVMENGWTAIGYHYFIDKQGMVYITRPTLAVGAHCAGHNQKSIGICVSGKTDFTEIQWKIAIELIKEIKKAFDIKRVRGHYELTSGKTCPNFDMVEFREDLNV